MGIFESGYALFEYTNQRIWDLYDLIASTPTIVKLFQANNNTKRKNRRKERGVVGSIQKKITPVKKQQSNYRFRLRDAENTSSASDQKVPAVKQVLPIPTTPAAGTAPEAPEKIKKLENELSKLREEINKLMANPKVSAGPTTTPAIPQHGMLSGGTCGTVSFPAHSVVPPSFVPPAAATSTPGFIPAPPAPPPVPSMLSTPSKPKAPPAERMMTKRHVQQKGSLSLAEVLRGASSTNLRKTDVDRSPGGTPLDTPSKKKQANPTDPQDIIAMALKKKFQSLHRLQSDTPESVSKSKNGRTKPDDDGWGDSDDSYISSPEKRTTPAKKAAKNNSTRKSKILTPVRDENSAPLENVDPAWA